MSDIVIEALNQTPIAQQRIELVERKGIGHPDTMCDAILEQVALALCQAYLATFGQVLHHNIDKGLLIAGRTAPRLGGGAVLEPMRLVVGDRATAMYHRRRLDIAEIVAARAKAWLRHNLRFVDPDQHLIIQNELKQGSPELTDLFERTTVGANDTSAAVGYAPLTETERIVLAAEHFLNAPAFKVRFPEAGEDVKVMGYRRDRVLDLTIALAFVDRFVPDALTYFARRLEIQHALDRITIAINTLDDPARGAEGMYLTVLSTISWGTAHDPDYAVVWRDGPSGSNQS